MKFTTKQRNFLIAPSLSHLFVYSHRVMFHILAEEGKWGDFLSEPLRDDGVWLVRQCNEVPPVPKSIVTVRRRKTVTKLPALSTKHPVQTCLSKLVSPCQWWPNPVNHCLSSNIHPPSSFVCVQLNIVAHRLNNPFGVSLDQTPYWTYIMPLEIHLKTMKQTMYLHSERYHLNPTWGKDEESWE